MAKVITAAQLDAIIAADEAVKGTPHYNRYYMEYQFKHNGRWHYGGWGIPKEYHNGTDKPVKTYGGNRYIMIGDDRRFQISDDVEELIRDI